MVGRKPKPDALKRLEGNPGKRPIDTKTKNLEVNTVDSLPYPDYFRGDDRAKKEWDRVCSELASYNMLCSLDLHILGVYCKAVSQIHECYNIQKRKGMIYEDETGRVHKNPITIMISKLTNEIRLYSTALGLNPSARKTMRVKNDNTKDNSKQAAILKYMKGGK